MTTDNTKDTAWPAIMLESGKISGVLMEMLKRLVYDGTREHIQESTQGAHGALKTIKVWTEAALAEAAEVGCLCPSCQEAQHHMDQVLIIINDGISHLAKRKAVNATEAAFSLGACNAQLVLIPSLIFIMAKMAQHTHDIAREILAGKIVELSAEDPPCSECGACGKDDEEETEKPN